MSNKNSISLPHRHIVIFGMLCLFFSIIVAQQNQQKQLRKGILDDQQKLEKQDNLKNTKPQKKQGTSAATNINQNASAANTKYVQLENSETWSYDKDFNADAQVLRGNVRFRHEDALMYCDSAYFYEEKNSLDAFGNVRIVQGDTLFVYGDILYYDGKKKLARLRHNVRMENRSSILTTDSLNYDRVADLAYYFTGGKIKDEVNVLTSIFGQYSPATKQALFKKNVQLVNPDFTMDSDTLQYNTRTNIANIVGPTHIIHKDETNIYSRLGWYNTSNEQSMLLKRSFIVHDDGKTLTGDTIFYDKIKKYGESFSRVELTDSVQKTTLHGNYLTYNEISEAGLATDSALMVDWSSKDTMYVHADTIKTLKDSVYDVVIGYKNVRIYRDDIQGIADSLIYCTRDSILNLHGLPVLWAEENQLSGEIIKAFTKNQKVERVHIEGSAITSQQEDSLFFNQLSGKEIIAYVDSGALKKIHVNGNAETLFYPRDDADSTLVGLNKTESSFVYIYLKDKKVDKIVLTSASNGIMYPLSQLSGSDLYLKNFFWLEEQRPKNKQDVFTVFPKKERVMPGMQSKSETKSADKGKQQNSPPPKNRPSDTNRSVNR